ncbi:PAS domain-containing protein [Methylobacter svalbardensis]|uniref:PAS domain-containing protein n=1 Tax=Methylobacter svalbardensis TaxID=3080016 RepID=UPI0030EC5EEA
MINEVIKQNSLSAERYHPLITEADDLPIVEWLHELRLHQIELERQSEEPRHAHVVQEESRDCYVGLYDFAPVGYLTLTREGLIAEINLTAARLLGVDRRKLPPHHFSTFVAPKDVECCQLFFSGIKKHNQRNSTELLLKRSDGAVFPVQMECLSVPSGGKGSILRIILTESKQAKRVLREDQTHTLDIDQASAKMGSWDWDIKTGRVIFNERWAKMRGYRLSDIESHIDTWENSIYPNDFPAYDAALTAHLENRTPFFQAEYRVRTRQGSLIWLLNRGTVIQRDTEGNPLHMAGIEMDVTELRNNDKIKALKIKELH